MSSATATARLKANTGNAQLSTGPKTEAGKARAAQNALKHGLTSGRIVLPHENREEYEALCSRMTTEWCPGSEYERELLTRMVDCWWRLARAHRVEAEFLAAREQTIRENNEGMGGDAALAFMLSDPAESAKFRLFLRYLNGAERAWYAALKEFRSAQKERLDREREQEMLQSMLESARERQAPKATVPVTKAPRRRRRFSGFVSQTRQTTAAGSSNPALRL